MPETNNHTETIPVCARSTKTKHTFQAMQF